MTNRLFAPHTDATVGRGVGREGRVREIEERDVGNDCRDVQSHTRVLNIAIALRCPKLLIATSPFTSTKTYAHTYIHLRTYHIHIGIHMGIIIHTCTHTHTHTHLQLVLCSLWLPC